MNAVIDNKIISIEYAPKKRLVIEYGIRQIENQTPYFYITAEAYIGNRMDACGCLHGEIEQYAEPDVSGLIKWHLCHITGEPIHYLDNSMYFWDQYHDSLLGKIEFENFRNCCVFGECEKDNEKLNDFEGRRMELAADDAIGKKQLRDDVREWLIGRMPELKTKFKTAMKAAGLKMQSS